MSFLGSDKSAAELFAEEEGEVAEEIWRLINEEESDLENLREAVTNKTDKSTIKRSERALESLSIMIEKDLEKIEEDEEKVENDLSQGNFGDDFRRAARHNLEVLRNVIENLEEDDKRFEEWVERIEQLDDPHEEVEEMEEIETRLEEHLEEIKGFMNSATTEYTDAEGWIDLSQFT